MGRVEAIAMPKRKVSELLETQAGRILIILEVREDGSLDWQM
jgi:hypothetical protein